MIKKLQKQQKMNCIAFYPLLPLIPCRIEHLQKKKDYHRKLCLKTWPGNHGDMI